MAEDKLNIQITRQDALILEEATQRAIDGGSPPWDGPGAARLQEINDKLEAYNHPPQDEGFSIAVTVRTRTKTVTEIQYVPEVDAADEQKWTQAALAAWNAVKSQFGF